MKGQDCKHLFGVMLLAAVPALVTAVSPAVGEKESVSMVLVLAVDLSSSVTAGPRDPDELRMQRAGVAAAFRSEQVIRVLEECNAEGVGLTYVEWSGHQQSREVRQVLPWQRLTDGVDALDFAQDVESLAQRSFNSLTDIAGSLEEIQKMIEEGPYHGPRKVISLSADGRQNTNFALPPSISKDDPDHEIKYVRHVRDRIVEAGTMINAIVIMNDRLETEDRPGQRPREPLDDYFRDHVIGGPGASATAAADFTDYGKALEDLLVSTLNNCHW